MRFTLSDKYLCGFFKKSHVSTTWLSVFTITQLIFIDRFSPTLVLLDFSNRLTKCRHIVDVLPYSCAITSARSDSIA